MGIWEFGTSGAFFVIPFDLFDKKRAFNFKSLVMGSYAPRLSDKKGFRGYFTIQELKGNLRFGLTWEGADKYYNQNELGFFSRNDFQSFSAMFSAWSFYGYLHSSLLMIGTTPAGAFTIGKRSLEDFQLQN